jgi:hypothetical protein
MYRQIVVFIAMCKFKQYGTYLENASISPYTPFNKSTDLAPMIHAKIVMFLPRFEPQTLGTVSKCATN